MQIMVKIIKNPLISTIIAIVCGFIVACIVLAISGFDPFSAMIALFDGVFGKPKHIVNVIMKSTPIIITGISVAFAFKTGLFNIGAEGQYIVGAVAALIVGIHFNFHPLIQVPLILISGILAGGIWGSIVGILKAKFGIHEVISSIMLNWIAFYLSNFIAHNPISPYSKYDTNGSYPINESGFTTPFYFWKKSAEGIKTLKSNKFLADLLSAQISYGIIIAVVLAIFIARLLKRTTKGYEFRAVGFNPHASKFAGINVGKNIFQSMMIAGAISGLAGALMITGGQHYISYLAMFENNGFNGLLVALVASSSPIGCIFSGLFFSAVIYGGGNIQSQIKAPSEIINIMIGTIVFFVALVNVLPSLVSRYKKRKGVRSSE